MKPPPPIIVHTHYTHIECHIIRVGNKLLFYAEDEVVTPRLEEDSETSINNESHSASIDPSLLCNTPISGKYT